MSKSPLFVLVITSFFVTCGRGVFAGKRAGSPQRRNPIGVRANRQVAVMRNRLFHLERERRAAALSQRMNRARYLNLRRRNGQWNQMRRLSMVTRSQVKNLVVQAIAGQVAAVQSLATLAIRDSRTPLINKRVLYFAAKNLGKKVGDGQCGTLGVAALAYAGARRTRWPVFGREVSLAESVPGDILQFTSARFDFPNGSYALLGIPDHTAIILWREGARVVILHQNAPVKSVTVMRIDMQAMTRGSVQVYRPLRR